MPTQRWDSHPLGSDRGSTLLLQLFLITSLLTVVAGISDVGRVIGARQQLAATADQAAIAGAQALDLAAYYANGASNAAGLALDARAVEPAVLRYLAPAVAAQQQPGLSVDSVSVADGAVTVRLRCTADLPFAGLLGLTSVPVHASATAALQVGA